MIVHYGHTRFMLVDDLPIVFLEARSQLNLISIIRKAQDKLLSWKKIGVATTVQHLSELHKIENYLNRIGIEVVAPPKGGHSTYSGQIIGCDYTPLKNIANLVEAFLIIGSKFHGLGASLAVNKPVVLAEPYSKQVINLREIRDKIIMRRYAIINKAKNANNIGIILGAKLGQHDPKGAITLKNKFAVLGKTAAIIVADEILPSTLDNFSEVEVFVNTACPRMALDDIDRFRRPTLLPKEALVVIGELKWEDLVEEGLL